MGVKVLVMDDEEDTLNMLAMTLKFAGYDVVTADTGHKTLALAVAQKPEVIILDVMMPDFSGIEVLKRLKLLLPALPPVIFLSASIRAADRDESRAIGAFTYLVKPVPRQKLIDTLKDALARARSSGAAG
jgi:two-component system OmpR family response regulator